VSSPLTRLAGPLSLAAGILFIFQIAGGFYIAGSLALMLALVAHTDGAFTRPARSA
jgi:hypothetical protein